MKILFVTAEVSPFAKTGGLGEVCGALPKALAELGHDVAIVTPFYRDTRHYIESHPIETRTVTDDLWTNMREGPASVVTAHLPGTNVPVYFVVNDRVFDRPSLYAPRADGVDDQLERFSYFCRAAIATAEAIDFECDIVHAHDWHTALLPIYLHAGLRETSLAFHKARSVFTIHNLNYQGRYGADRYRALALGSTFWNPNAVEYYGDLNLMKGAIVFSDQLTTVSPTYAAEIQTPQFGAGLDGLLRDRNRKLSGIVNGIDLDIWSPESDRLIAANYSDHDLAGKAACKRALRKEAGLAPTARTPLVGIVSRLVDQKGFDLLLPIIPIVTSLGAQIVILGTGMPEYEERLRELENLHPKQLRVWIGFDTPLSHRIFAGSDLTLIPSHYEPCGLNQMYGLRYATLPVVRLTGGLADTVTPYNGVNRGSANGFGFRNATIEELYYATWVSLLIYRDSKAWRHLQRNGMEADFSWESSAKQYVAVYERTRL